MNIIVLILFRSTSLLGCPIERKTSLRRMVTETSSSSPGCLEIQSPSKSYLELLFRVLDLMEIWFSVSENISLESFFQEPMPEGILESMCSKRKQVIELVYKILQGAITRMNNDSIVRCAEGETACDLETRTKFKELLEYYGLPNDLLKDDFGMTLVQLYSQLERVWCYMMNQLPRGHYSKHESC
ncbi:hypothetical protein B0J14DRAFT_609732 [Halenospora varia]|nr:hypothetical protein B0J14DRAFT_609732 [Halenospora varia]